MDTSNQ